MLNLMDIELMRRLLHGADSTLQLVREKDDTLVLALLVESHFAVTRQRDAETGGLVDRLTIRLDGDDKSAAWKKSSAVVLTVKSTDTRYRLDAKSDSRQDTTLYGFATATMMQNESTAIVAEPVP